ncbi:MAG: cytochrome C [Betaproteobacteria bacterium]
MKKHVRVRHVVNTLWASAALALLPVSGVFADNDDQDRGGSESQVQRGFQISPPGVKLNFKGKSRDLVGLGSYIVNTTGCNDCHTYPSYVLGGDPFRGQPELINAPQYMTGGRQFGPFTSANLTPDKNGNPAGLTLAQFLKTLRTGHNPYDPPGQLLQVMPWPVFGKKTERDLSAIYEYLKALPSLPDNPNPGP